MSSQDDFIREFNKTRVNNPIFVCHNFGNSKKFPIDSSSVIKFYKGYSDLIVDNDEEIIPTLGEVTDHNIPLISEFYFKFEKDENIEVDQNYSFYDKKLIHSLAICHHKVIGSLINVSARNTEYVCAVCESKPWIENNYYVVKLTLQFPYLKLGKEFINTTFRNKLLSQIRKARIEGYFTYSTPIGDWSSHLQAVKDIYPLYGSSINSKTPPSTLVGIFGEHQDGICKSISLQKAYEYRNHCFIKSGQCDEEDVELLDSYDIGEVDIHMQLLPMFLSVFFYSVCANIKNQLENETSSSCYSEEYSEDYYERIEEMSDLEICLELIDMLNEKRFNNESYFLDIGRALFNATKGSEEGLKIWTRLGIDRDLDYDEDYYEDQYENFDKSHISYKTLGWYAKRDNFEKYEDWHKSWCLPKLTQCLHSGGAHVPVAEAFYRVFWLEYFFSNGRWYAFRDHILVSLAETIPLRNAITNGLIPYFESFNSQYISVKKGEENEEKEKSLEKSIKETKKIIKNLQTESYRNQIIISSQTYFWKENIHRVLNKDPRLLGAKNCVIELTAEKAFAREGKPEDYITKKLGVRYKYKYNFDHKDITDLLLYFRQVFPHPELNEHMKKDISSILYGRNAEKIFRVWIGDTNGSKSIYQKTIRNMLGDYYCDLPPEYYSAQQKASNGPNPELAQTEDARVGFSAEPDDDISIKGPRVKRVTGGDSYFARNCNQDGGSIETSFKPIMVLNVVPDITGMDEATKNRFCMIPFECRWLKPEEIDKLEYPFPEDVEEQIKLKTFVMDEKFEDQIPRMAGALLWLSVYYYRIYLQTGLKTPPYVQKWMNEYWKRNDSYTSFIAERLEQATISRECKECKEKEIDCKVCNNSKFVKEIDMEKSITATELFPEFKRWFFETYPNKKKDQFPDKKKFVTIMSGKDKLKKQHNRRWWGISLRRVDNLED